MNVIVANKQKDIIDNANIDAIKDFNGLFNVEDLISKFKNYFFSKIILDATSIVNFTSKDVLGKLANEIGSERLIILLPQGEEPPKSFTDLLISLKIYNFSTNIDDIVKFINNPNTYENVTSNEENSGNNSFYVDNSIKADESYIGDNLTSQDNIDNEEINQSKYQDNSISDNNAISSEYALEDDINNSNVSNIDNKVNNNYNINGISNNEGDIFTPTTITNEIVNDNNNYNVNNVLNDNFYNSTLNNNNINANIMENNNAMTPNNVNNNFMNNQFINVGKQNNINANTENMLNKIIVGFRNVTSHAGSTTLIYLMKKALEEYFHKKVCAIEINRNDFKYFNEKNMLSSNENELRELISRINVEIILVDLNDYYGSFDLFNETLYLIEPSVIKLNTLMMQNRLAFRELMNKKIILNKSLLSSKDVQTLSSEAGVPMFMNIEPLNDRILNNTIINLIKKLDL